MYKKLLKTPGKHILVPVRSYTDLLGLIIITLSDYIYTTIMTTKPAKSIVPITVIALFAVFGISVATGFIMNAGFSAFSSKVTPTGTPTGFGSLSTPDDPSAAVGNRSTDGCRITSANQLKLRVPATNSTPTGAARKLFLGATALMSTTDEASDQGPFSNTASPGTHSTPGHIKTTGTNSAINGNSTWTAAAYINPEAALRSSALSTNHFIISAIDEDSAQKGWYVYLDSTGHVVAGMSAGGLATWSCTTDLSIAEVVGLTRPYDSTSWLHVAAVYNNSSSSAIYINGYVVPCTASGSYDNVASQQNLGNSGTITLGQSAGTVPFSFYGSIDDTYVNTSALTASSVAALVCPAPSLSTAVLVRDNCMGVTTTPLGSDSLNFLAVQGSGAAWPNIPSPAFSANSGVREAQLSRNNLIDSGFNSVGNDSSSPARRSLVSTEQGTNASSLGSSSFSLALWVRGLSPTYINSNPPTFLKSRSWTLAASSDGTNDTNDKLKLVIAGAEGAETYITTSSVPLYAASDLSDAAGYSNRAHMIAATYNDSDNTVCFYFDGALVEACKPDASLTRLPSYYQTFLSVASDALGATYTMTLDDIFGYSAVLSKNSIERLWLSAVPEGNILP